jgi:hypothetical protein
VQKAFLREEGGPLAVEGACVHKQLIPRFAVIASPKSRTLPQSPSVTAPSRREPPLKTSCAYPLLAFCSSVSLFEPRDYRVVFCYKQKEPPRWLFLQFMPVLCPSKEIRSRNFRFAVRRRTERTLSGRTNLPKPRARKFGAEIAVFAPMAYEGTSSGRKR